MIKIALPPLPLIEDEPHYPTTIEIIIRARDLEVARLVLEAAATWIESQRNDIPATGKEFAAAIRALEISHD